MNLGIYIHIPFCHKEKCDYCDFYSIPVQTDNTHWSKLIDNYIKSLCSEIAYYSTEFSDYIVDTIYIGGGTPSLLNSHHYSILLNTIKNYYAIAPEIEITIECNPDNYSIHYITELKEIGINRFVLGVQTLDKKAHNYIGRKPQLVDAESIKEFCTIPDIISCIDILVGIPEQTVSSFISSLNTLIQYKPKHISAYILTFEKNTPLSIRVPYSNKFSNFQRKIFEKTIKTLTDSGYLHYEISNFALPHFESRHNCKYWNFDEYIGLGSGAHSFYKNKRYYNSTLFEYLQNPITSRFEDVRQPKDVAIEFLMNKLRLTDGFIINELYLKTSYIPSDNFKKALEQLISKKLLEIFMMDGHQRLRCTHEGMFMLDSILFELMSKL
ncbi:MAG: radical SAM family heme chaperone HemW [Spirochaetes bacterium]|nr:radical SAM family heme chaperone HemW [Spirochaetota bacterium]